MILMPLFLHSVNLPSFECPQTFEIYQENWRLVEASDEIKTIQDYEKITTKDEGYYQAYQEETVIANIEAKYPQISEKFYIPLITKTPKPTITIGHYYNGKTLEGDVVFYFTSGRYRAKYQEKTKIFEYRKPCYYCNQNDTEYPTERSNEEIFFEWTEDEPNRALECNEVFYGKVEEKKELCKTKYRCVVPFETCQIEQPVCTGSYVDPKNKTYNEDVFPTGVNFALHYSSKNGWNISSYAKLNKDTLILGSGKELKVEPYQENGKTVVNLFGTKFIFTNNLLTSKVDVATGNVLETFGYYNTILTSITDRFGKTTHINADSIVSPEGQTTYLIYEGTNLVQIRFEDDSSYIFEYTNGLMTRKVLPNGSESNITYNNQKRVINVIDGENEPWNFEYDDNETKVIKPAGDVISYKKFRVYQHQLRARATMASGRSFEKINNDKNNKEIINQFGISIEKDYLKDENGTLIKDEITNSKVLIQSKEKMPSGLEKISIFNKNNVFDESHNLLRTERTISINGVVESSVKDYINKSIVSTSSEGIVSEKLLNDKELVISSRYGNLIPQTFEYTSDGKILSEKQGLREINYEYDLLGRISKTIDILGQETLYEYDVLNRLISIEYPDGYIANFTYDASGNMTSIITPKEHEFTYNGVNKKVGYISPLAKSTSYEYDAQRRLTKVVKPSGSFIEYVYDKGLLKYINDSLYTYNCLDNITSITNGAEGISYNYDGSLLTGINYTGVMNQNIGFNYDNNFLINSISYAGVSEGIVYNQDGLMINKGDYNLIRNENGFVSNLFGNDLNQTREYNGFGEITKISDGVFSYELERDNLGRIIQKKENLAGEETIFNYEYNSRGRLAKVFKDGNVSEEYSYDEVGNRLSGMVNGVVSEGSFTLDDQLVVYGQNSYRYDDDGYLVEKTTPEGVSTYEYGLFGELKKVVLSDGKVVEYLHNAKNQRVAKLVNGVVIEKYLWLDLTTLLAVYDGSGELVSRFEFADGRMPVAMVQNGIRYSLHYNQLGSLVAVSDSSGNLVREVSYDSYGRILSSEGSVEVPFGFAGGLYDKDTSLTRFGYRDYDSFTGKWTAKDPIGFEGGDYNLYGYVLGDPVNFLDPTGEFLQFIPVVIWYGLGAGLAVGIVDERINSGGWKTVATDVAICTIAVPLAASGGPLWLIGVTEFAGIGLSSVGAANGAAEELSNIKNKDKNKCQE